MFFVLDFIVHNIFFVYILPEDGHRSGPKHVVVVHNKIGHEKHLLRTVVLIKALVDTRATGCITQQLSYVYFIFYIFCRYIVWPLLAIFRWIHNYCRKL
jgi:hypothetical protein